MSTNACSNENCGEIRRNRQFRPADFTLTNLTKIQRNHQLNLTYFAVPLYPPLAQENSQLD